MKRNGSSLVKVNNENLLWLQNQIQNKGSVLKYWAFTEKTFSVWDVVLERTSSLGRFVSIVGFGSAWFIHISREVAKTQHFIKHGTWKQIQIYVTDHGFDTMTLILKIDHRYGNGVSMC